MFVFGVKLKDVECLFALQLLLYVQLMCDLVFGLDKIEFGDDARMRLEACLTDGEQVLNAVLCLLPHFSLMQQSLESLEDSIGPRWSQFAQHLTNLHHEVASNFHGILSGTG